MDEEENAERIITDEEGSNQAARNANRRYRDAARKEDSYAGIFILCQFSNA